MWDWTSVIIYIGFAVIGGFLLKQSIMSNTRDNTITYGGAFILIWTFMAVFRYVSEYNGFITGGSDAPTYISYFKICNVPNNHLYEAHTEFLFKLLTKFIRKFTDNYRLYFLIIYSFITYAYFKFLKNINFTKISYAPLFMIMIVYAKAFSSIRTGIAIACILLGVIKYDKKKYVSCVLLMTSSVLFQRSSIIYAVYPLFAYIHKNGLLKRKKAVIYTLLGFMFGIIAQRVLMSSPVPFFKGGAYAKYILRSLEDGYFTDYMKIIADQVIVLVLYYLYLRKSSIYNRRATDWIHRTLDSMWCFDCLMTPICYVLNIWRASEYFFVPRLLMLGIFIYDFRKKITDDSKTLYDCGTTLILILWFIIRLSTIYDVTDLMPLRFHL